MSEAEKRGELQRLERDIALLRQARDACRAAENATHRLVVAPDNGYGHLFRPIAARLRWRASDLHDWYDAYVTLHRELMAQVPPPPPPNPLSSEAILNAYWDDEARVEEEWLQEIEAEIAAEDAEDDPL
jgi:hypothetical protein